MLQPKSYCSLNSSAGFNIITNYLMNIRTTTWVHSHPAHLVHLVSYPSKTLKSAAIKPVYYPPTLLSLPSLSASQLSNPPLLVCCTIHRSAAATTDLPFYPCEHHHPLYSYHPWVDPYLRVGFWYPYEQHVIRKAPAVSLPACRAKKDVRLGFAALVGPRVGSGQAARQPVHVWMWVWWLGGKESARGGRSSGTAEETW